MEKCHLCYIILILIKFRHGLKIISQDDDNIMLHQCVTTIIQRIEFVKATDVTLINVDVELAKELHSLPHPVRFISRSFYWPNDTLFNDVYVVQCQNIFEFAHGLDLMKRDPFWNPRAKFIIIVEYPEMYIQDISDFLMHNHIYNVALVTYSEFRSIFVYTFGHENDECCRPRIKKLKLRNRCSEVNNKDISKIVTSGVACRNLRGCHVKFVSQNYWPFVSFAGKPAVETYLLELIREHENITVELVNFGSVENFGSRLDNFTYTGMLHEIEIFKVEGAIGGFILTFNRMSNLDFIDPYMVDRYRIVIPRAKLLNKWGGVIKQFRIKGIWATFIVFIIICITAMSMGLFKKQPRDLSRDILIVWGYFFNNIYQKQIAKSGVPYRMVLLNILIYVFMLSYALQASLLSATTHPIREFQPNTADEVTSDYQLLISPNSHAHLLKNPVIDLTNANTSCKNTLDCMMKVMMHSDRRFFALTSDLYHQSYVWNFADENGELKIHTIKEPVGTLLQTMYIRRGSSLAGPFNELLRRIKSAGLVDQFLDRLHFSERLKHKFRSRRQRKPQSLKGLKGVFMILIYGAGVSVITFVLECIGASIKNIVFKVSSSATGVSEQLALGCVSTRAKRGCVASKNQS